MLTVTDVKAAAAFYQKAFGFAKRGIMNGPDGKAIHAELTLRGTTLMLGPEIPQMGARSAKTIGSSPASLYLLTENADKVVAGAVKLGAVILLHVQVEFGGKCKIRHRRLSATHRRLPSMLVAAGAERRGGFAGSVVSIQAFVVDIDEFLHETTNQQEKNAVTPGSLVEGSPADKVKRARHLSGPFQMSPRQVTILRRSGLRRYPYAGSPIPSNQATRCQAAAGWMAQGLAN